jgi:hypothetical protein
MSTTARGEAFERRVYEALSGELRKERLCASPKHAKLLRKKGYRSRDRDSDIVTDVSIGILPLVRGSGEPMEGLPLFERGLHLTYRSQPMAVTVSAIPWQILIL